MSPPPVLPLLLKCLKAACWGLLGTGSAIVGADLKWYSALSPAADTCGRAEKCALKSLSVPVPINLKCDPERAIELRDEYAAIEPGDFVNENSRSEWHLLSRLQLVASFVN